MFREFFVGPCGRESAFRMTIAWIGLLVIVGHAIVHGLIKYWLNQWYKDFYDLLQTAGALAARESVAPEEWADARAHVYEGLVDFCKIAGLSVIVMPLARFVRSSWALQWRVALGNAYLSCWATPAIEGASQRLHEDTYKFSRGIELFLSVGLDSVITLSVFSPLLVQLGREVDCPVLAFEWAHELWLLFLALACVLVGMTGTLVFGRRLVFLEIQNQVVEAAFRTDLVILEKTPSVICQDSPDNALFPPLPHFLPVLKRLQTNYLNLFCNFTVLNLWLALYEQFATILPYLVFAPLLFQDDNRVSLGVLIQVSNSFDKVFSSLNVIADNWVGINEFLSCVVRLRQFENNIYRGVPHPHRAAPRRRWPPCFRPPRAIFGSAAIEVEVVGGEGDGTITRA